MKKRNLLDVLLVSMMLYYALHSKGGWVIFYAFAAGTSFSFLFTNALEGLFRRRLR